MEIKMIYNDYEKVCNSSTIYIVLFAKFSLISRRISSVFIYFHWYLKKYNTECYSIERAIYITYKWEISSK